ncbi:hypothetical protein WJX74_002466 [Apatococcus lobatus]|uniref:Polymerase nucleotidyl transferase domain-containing protein n=1 Tax=Apatococcus lobatus TaxID=904363 RepID=A0AAW1R1R1_9CHLO
MPGGSAWRQFQQSFPRSNRHEQHPGHGPDWQSTRGQHSGSLDVPGFSAQGFHYPSMTSAGSSQAHHNSYQHTHHQQALAYDPGLNFQPNPQMTSMHHQGHVQMPESHHNKRQRLNNPKEPPSIPWHPPNQSHPTPAAGQFPSSFFGGHLFSQQQPTCAAPSLQGHSHLGAHFIAADPVHGCAMTAVPVKEELQRVVEAVHRIGKQACDLWPGAKTALFGSQANGLSLPGSDLDIVILGVSDPLQQAGSGFAKNMRKRLCNMLRDLLRLLRRCGLVIGKGQIIEARIPIIKCKVTIGSSHLSTDISLGTANGLSSVQYIGWQLSRLPAIRPLTLAIKALLRELGLNEVFSGGLSSYSVVNMVMAYLSLEGMSLAQHMQPGTPALPEISHTISSPPAAQQDVAWRLQQTFSRPAQQDMDCDLGNVLKGFLGHFGNRFDNRTKAVSVHYGGFINKRPEWRDGKKPNALAVEDPQEPGKDVAAGTFRIPEIKEVFKQALQELEDSGGEMGGSNQGWAHVQADGQDRSTSAGSSDLSAILDLHAAVGRDHQANQARKEFETKARSYASPKMKMMIKIHRKVKVALPGVRQAGRPIGAIPQVMLPAAPGKRRKGKGKRPPASGKRHQQVPGSLGKKRRRMMERTGNFE